MNVREMHIEIDQSSQLVAANRTRKWYPEEKDWVLNKIMFRYIESCLVKRPDGSGGFELDQSKADGIRNLIKTKQALTAWVDSDVRYKSFLPADYLHLLSDASYTKANCGAADPALIGVLHYLSKIKQIKSEKAEAPFYETLILTLENIETSVPDELPYNNEYLGYPEKEDISFLVPYILWKTGLRWERFDDKYFPSHYMLFGTTTPTGGELTIDGDESAVYDTTAFTLQKHTPTGHAIHNNRLTASNMVNAMLPTSFFKPSYISPISELERDILWIYRDNSFTVSHVEISYIRKPQPISLSLGTDCELSGESTHQKLCDLAVEYLQGRTKDLKGVQMSEADIAKRIIL